MGNIGNIAIGDGGLQPPSLNLNGNYGHGSPEHLDLEDQQAGIRNFGSGQSLNLGNNGLNGLQLGGNNLQLSAEQIQGPINIPTGPSGPGSLGGDLLPPQPIGQQIQISDQIQTGLQGGQLQGQYQGQFQSQIQGQIQAQQSYRVHLGQQATQTVQVNRHIHVLNKYGNIIPKPYPVQVTRDVPVPVEQPYPVKVDRPYPVKVPKPYHVHEYKEIPYPVYKNVPHPVPYRVEIPHHYHVKVPVPQPYQVPRPVPVPVKVNVPVPVVRHYPVYYKQLHAHIHQPPAHLHIH